MPRFVILEHDHPHLHWDLMLEAGAVLWTWRLASPPRGQGDETIAAERIGDHRPAYLDYEGPVSGGRGRVTRWDGGTYKLVEGNDARLALELSGERLTGTALLEKREQTSWQLQLVSAGAS